jgi:hypothetical protein
MEGVPTSENIRERLGVGDAEMRNKTLIVGGGVLLGVIIVVMLILTLVFGFSFGEAALSTALAGFAFLAGFGVAFFLRSKQGKKLFKKAAFKTD